MNRSVSKMHTFGEFNKNQMNRTCLLTRRQIDKNVLLVPWIGYCINMLQVTTFILSATSYYKGVSSKHLGDIAQIIHITEYTRILSESILEINFPSFHKQTRSSRKLILTSYEDE